MLSSISLDHTTQLDIQGSSCFHFIYHCILFSLFVSCNIENKTSLLKQPKTVLLLGPFDLIVFGVKSVLQFVFCLLSVPFLHFCIIKISQQLHISQSIP